MTTAKIAPTGRIEWATVAVCLARDSCAEKVAAVHLVAAAAPAVTLATKVAGMVVGMVVLVAAVLEGAGAVAAACLARANCACC